MKIETMSARIVVDCRGSSSGANISPVLSGFAAEICFWGEHIYVAKRKDDSFYRLLIVPGPKWTEDLKDGGYEIVGELKDIMAIAGLADDSLSEKDDALERAAEAFDNIAVMISGEPDESDIRKAIAQAEGSAILAKAAIGLVATSRGTKK